MQSRPKLAIVAIAAITAGLSCAAWWAFSTAPGGALGTAPADALIVFGSPAEIDGAPSAMQTWRVREAVAEYRKGVAPHVLFTGGAAGNKWIEADVMAREACSLGVPTEAILRERRSRTTVENLQGVARIMQIHQWHSAELISSADHLPRIAVLARQAPYRWRLHAAPTPGRGRLSTSLAYVEEAAAVLILRIFGSSAEPVIHGIATIEHGVFFVPRLILWKIRNHGAPYIPSAPPPEQAAPDPPEESSQACGQTR